MTDVRVDSVTVVHPVTPLEPIDLEEKYRVRIGTRLREVPPTATAKHFFQTSKGISLSAGALIAVLAAIFLITGRHNDPTPVAGPARQINTRYVPQSLNVVTGKVNIKPAGLAQYPITIESEMYEATLKGSFEGEDGSEILVIVAEEAEFQNWTNGHATQVLWGTDKPRASGTFEILLRPGTYHLVFSNKFSEHYDKTVSVQTVLSFKRQETY